MNVVDAILAENADRIPAEQLSEVRENLIRERLEPLIDQKLIVADFRRNIPEENYPLVRERIGDVFEESEIERLMRSSGARTRVELDQKLADMGMSLERQKETFIETMLARQWLREQMRVDDEITHAQILAYYYDHQDDFAIAGKVRWQHVMVRFDRHPTKAAAWRRLAEVGNRLWAGEALDQVARQFSDGSTAASGGHRDWTTEGSLVSQRLNQALFGLPIGTLSQILEGPRGFHIVRVLERKEAGLVPFVEAQVEIKKKIRQQRNRDRSEVYLTELRERIPTWTILDESKTTPSFSRRGEASPRR